MSINASKQKSGPEERVRQEYLQRLMSDYGYPADHLDIERGIQFGSNHRGAADIVVYKDKKGRNQHTDIEGMIETKAPNLRLPEGSDARRQATAQLASYMSASSCKWGVLTNGNEFIYLRKNPNGEVEEVLQAQPHYGHSLAHDISSKDQLKPVENLKAIFRDMLHRLLANTNISRREKLGNEMVRLLFCKLYDERYHKDSPPRFQVHSDEAPEDTARRIRSLFREVLQQTGDSDTFEASTEIVLDSKSIVYVVDKLQYVSLQKTRKDAVGSAFEVFAESSLVGEKGEFFTPREVVEIAVRMADPGPGQTICDPACGSGGFLVYALDYIWNKMPAMGRWRGMSGPQMQKERSEIAAKTIYGIDKEVDLMRIAKAYMTIIGDGRSNIVCENTLHPLDEYNPQAKSLFDDGGRMRQFDFILTNPPFGSKHKVVASDSAAYHLGKSPSSGKPRATPPQELFVERCLDMLGDGGTMAMVLPESYLHAPRKAHIMEHMCRGNNIKAILDIPSNAFQPHCGIKTCLVVVEKGRAQQDAVQMAVAEQIGNDHRGEPLYRPGTDELWDDSKAILQELDNGAEQMVFNHPVASIEDNVWVPRYYWPDNPYIGQMRSLEQRSDGALVSIWQLLDAGVLHHCRGHGSPEARHKGTGEIPYIRTSNIQQWMAMVDPYTMVPRDEYQRLMGGKEPARNGDILIVRRGGPRLIGEVAMLTDDQEMLLTAEIERLRVLERDNEWDIDQYYLLYLLSSPSCRAQWRAATLVDTTFHNMAERWRNARLFVPHDKAERKRARDKTRRAVQTMNSFRKMRRDIMG